MTKAETMAAIMRQTALKFFPRADDVVVGGEPIPYAMLTVGSVKCEVRVSGKYSLEDFEREAWLQFKKLQTSLEMNSVADSPEVAITIEDE